MDGRPPFSGAVLTGGASRRMGQDKALLPVGGRALVTVAAAALREAGAVEVLAVGGDAAALADLGLRTVADRFPGQGPLGGILTALAAATEDVVVVLACDLPHASADGVGAVLAALGEHAAAVPVVAGRWEALHAAWRRRALPALAMAWEKGERAPWRAVQRLDVQPVALADASWVADADTVEDLPPS